MARAVGYPARPASDASPQSLLCTMPSPTLAAEPLAATPRVAAFPFAAPVFAAPTFAAPAFVAAFVARLVAAPRSSCVRL